MSDEIGEAVNLLNDTVRLQGGLGCYVMVLKKEGQTESFRAAFNKIDGWHFYSHLVQTLNDDIREELDPDMVVAVIHKDVAKMLKETLKPIDTDPIPANTKPDSLSRREETAG